MASAVAAFNGKESLSQALDFDRPCSATLPGERCWLNSDLTHWNQVLHRLALELVETRRGGLRLSWETMKIARDPDIVSRDAAFLASRLLCHHTCIDELALRCVADTGRLEKPAFIIGLRPSSSVGESVRVIRSLIVCEMPFEEARRHGTLYTLQGVDAIGCLETLSFRSHGYKTKLTSDLGALLQRNQNSLKCVQSVYSEEAMNSRDQAASLLGQSFEVLNTFDTFTAIDAIKPLLGASTHLKELAVNVHGSELSVFAGAVAAMKTLTKLVVLLHKSTPAALFDVLKVNSTLNWLCVTFSLLSPNCERALASALRTNATLRHLELIDFQCTSSLADLAEALSDNTTLEFLVLDTFSLQITAILALCRALRTNKTLKTLKLRSGSGNHDERAALADELAHSGSYSRICVPLAVPDLPGLTVTLASATACPQELDFSDNIWHFDNAVLISLFDAVASSYVRNLRVIVLNDPGAKCVLFCKMLTKVGNLRCMDLACRELFARKVLRAVALNNSIDSLLINILDPVYLRTAEALSYMLSLNESLTEVTVYTEKNAFSERAGRGIAHALSQNRRIMYLSLPFVFKTDCSVSFAIMEALRNNNRELHRAIHFAILPTEDRLCAEAFELFFGSPVFRRQLVAVADAPQAEVTQILNSARNYLLDNYLVITGVVRQNVVRCHPSHAATQADALTSDCWRAIARYLRITDVIA